MLKQILWLSSSIKLAPKLCHSILAVFFISYWEVVSFFSLIFRYGATLYYSDWFALLVFFSDRMTSRSLLNSHVSIIVSYKLSFKKKNNFEGYIRSLYCKVTCSLPGGRDSRVSAPSVSSTMSRVEEDLQVIQCCVWSQLATCTEEDFTVVSESLADWAGDRAVTGLYAPRFAQRDQIVKSLVKQHIFYRYEPTSFLLCQLTGHIATLQSVWIQIWMTVMAMPVKLTLLKVHVAKLQAPAVLPAQLPVQPQALHQRMQESEGGMSPHHSRKRF